VTFDADVYVSYAQRDDIELVEGEKGWIANFVRALELRMSQLLGRPAVVRFVPKLASDVFDENIRHRLARAACFVAVVSPQYVWSDWSKKELETFVDAANEQGGLRVGDTTRVLKVMKSPVALEDQPSVLQTVLGYEFFSVDPDTSQVREFDRVLGPEAERDFWLRLDDLAQDLIRSLEHLEPNHVEAGQFEPPASLPRAGVTPPVVSETPAPVLLAVAAPHEAQAGSTFAARFVAYIEEMTRTVQKHLRDLDRNAASGTQSVLGLTPDRESRWRVGTPVTVRLSGEYLHVDPAARSFEWNGRENLVSFVVGVDAEAPADSIQLCFEAFIEGVSIAFVPLALRIGPERGAAVKVIETASPSNAFASYASQDAPLVALCLSALKRWDPGLDIFMDCLDLTPNEDWQRELARVIPTKEAFLLFWSVNARQSPWVAWELHVAESSKGLQWIRPMPIDDPALAPPPDELKHLHFGDRYLIAREALLRRTYEGRSIGNG
jgi:hypothetical protein